MSQKHKAIILNGDYLGSESIDLDFPCEIHFSRFGNKRIRTNIINNDTAYEKINFIDKESYKVFVCSNEPSSSANRELNETIINNSFQYDLILTSEKKILENTKNSIFFPYGTTWLNKDKHHIDALGTFDENLLNSISDKQFNVSFITTHHRRKDGYELRHFIWNNRHLIKIPTVFYSSTRNITTQYGYSDTLHDGLLPNDDKINLFKSQFSIAIESTQEDSYFSEKLIDCLLTKTIPIYWGASNIGDFFDTRGMICFNSIEEFIEKINSIDENTYETLKPYIEINFEKAKQYGKSFFSRIKEQIELNSKNQFDKKDILWTIGILSIPQRKKQLNRLLNHIETITPKRFAHRIEILVNCDNSIKSIGNKRQEILNDAKGKYVSFVDDDDMVTKSYISKICDVLDEDKYDGVGFLGLMYYTHSESNIIESSIPVLIFSHTIRNKTNYKSDDGRVQYRPLNHLNPIKTEIARQIGFDDANHGEDMKFSDKLVEMNLIKNDYYMEEVMYHYLFDISK